MCWTYGQCCVFSMWVLGSNIVKDCTHWTYGQCCVFSMGVVRSNIAIGVYSLDMWSVLCVIYVSGGI